MVQGLLAQVEQGGDLVELSAEALLGLLHQAGVDLRGPSLGILSPFTFTAPDVALA